MINNIAQTNIQLYNQLQQQGYSLDELMLVKQAYELAKTLVSGQYRANGQPTICHFIGVASIVAHLGLPGEFVATGLLHNIYSVGNFGDGLYHQVRDSQRHLVRSTAGKLVEDLIIRFFLSTRIKPQTLKKISRTVQHLGEIERKLLVIDFADRLEKYVDLGELYSADNDWVIGFDREHRDELLAIARHLEVPGLANMLSAAIDEAARMETEIPDVLRSVSPQDDHLGAFQNGPFGELIVPLSCRYRIRPRLARMFQARFWRLRATLRTYPIIRTIKRFLRRDLGSRVVPKW